MAELTEESYNDRAVKISAQIHSARSVKYDRDRAEPPPIPARFPKRDRAGLGVALEYERMGNRPISASLEARAKDLGVRFEHLGITLGTVIHDIDLRQPLSETQVSLLRDTLLERKVIFFRDQALTEDEHEAFARQFGDLDAFPFGKAGENPYILEIRHDELRPGTENGWHTDVTWMEEPSLGSIAQCIEMPPMGGDTLFADSHACYLGLPADLQARIEYLHGINDYRYFLYSIDSEELADKIKATIPFGVKHPLVRTHPETKKPALYFNSSFLRHDSLFDSRNGEPLDPQESVAIVEQLVQQHGRPEYMCRFQWQPGSIAFWDNRAVQHYAASDYFPHSRLLRRVTISGDRPYYDPSAYA